MSVTDLEESLRGVRDGVVPLDFLEVARGITNEGLGESVLGVVVGVGVTPLDAQMAVVDGCGVNALDAEHDAFLGLDVRATADTAVAAD